MLSLSLFRALFRTLSLSNYINPRTDIHWYRCLFLLLSGSLVQIYTLAYPHKQHLTIQNAPVLLNKRPEFIGI